MSSPPKQSLAAKGRLVRELVVLNRYGLHARPAALFARISNRFKADIWVEKDNQEVNGKSIMGLMMLAAGKGSVIRVSSTGLDAEEALKEIECLVASRFHEL